MKVKALSALIQLLIYFTASDFLCRYVSQNHNSIKPINALHTYYKKQRISDSAVENCVVGLIGMMAIVYLCGVKFGKGMRIQVDNSMFLFVSLFAGFWIGVLDKTWVRKEDYQTYNGIMTPLWGGAMGSLYFTWICIIMMSINKK